VATVTHPLDAYDAWLRTRWAARTRALARVAFLGTVVLAAFDLVFAGGVGTTPGSVAAVRLPCAALAIAGWLVQRHAGGWRLLPAATVAASVTWTWGIDAGYHQLGLGGTPLQAIAFACCIITAGMFLPLRGSGRAAVLALMIAGHAALDVALAPAGALRARLWTDLALLAFAAVQMDVFSSFGEARRRGLRLHQELVGTVAALEASRRAAAVSEERVRALAADVAHAVNSPLAAVKANVGWLDAHPAADASERDEVVRDALEAIERIADTVDELRSERLGCGR